MKRTFRTIKNIIKSVIEHDYFGMASEMGFMLCIGICPFILFLTALFGYMGKQNFMQPIFVFMQSIMPQDVLNVVNTVLNEVFFFKKGGLVAVLGFCITLFLSTNTVAIVAKGLNRACEWMADKESFAKGLKDSQAAEHSWLVPDGAMDKYAEVFVKMKVFKPEVLQSSTNIKDIKAVKFQKSA